MGFGHRVYKTGDPRASILKKYCIDGIKAIPERCQRYAESTMGIATAATFHLPTEPIFIILGIDALMDMGRTAVNVIGNCLACAVIARWEGELGEGAQVPTILETTVS